jgi:DNA-binding NarL/FixJ family response regulator
MAEGQAMLEDVFRTSTKVGEVAPFDNTPIEHNSLNHLEYSGTAEAGVLAIIDRHKFLQECIQRSVQSALSMRVETYSSLLEFGNKLPLSSIRLIIASLSDVSVQAATNTVQALADIAGGVPIVVLSDGDQELARAIIGRGARGFIPVTMRFEIAIEAVRFVLAGGTYVPADFLLKAASPEGALPHYRPAIDAVTSRELTVVRAIQQGKPNKIIARELRVAESTVKVHVRNIMRKLAAKNRTDVAIKYTRLVDA